MKAGALEIFVNVILLIVYAVDDILAAARELPHATERPVRDEVAAELRYHPRFKFCRLLSRPMNILALLKNNRDEKAAP